MPKRTQRVAVGDVIPARELIAASGDPVSVPDSDRLVHLQLRRFAGCPICSLHLRSLSLRHDEVVAAGIREVVVFHSTVEELRGHGADLPFAVVADPDKRLYAELGVEASPRAVLDPRAWVPVVRALFNALRATFRKERPAPPVAPHGGRLGLPADFLIASDGRVLACKYGAHAYDQWSI